VKGMQSAFFLFYSLWAKRKQGIKSSGNIKEIYLSA
jgi:hypothetical protein